MAGCCGCFAALKPRYKRLVDDIFPVNSEDGLVKNNMDKLTFYAMTSPEKLDRIGQYLEQRLSRDISRHRLGFVVIAMDALDQLLVSCHSHSLNLFVESYLKMVQKLLECEEPDLQVLATQSFMKFANIEEDNPSYHRRYDFFISKFSEMCHNGHRQEAFRTKIRTAGLRGLQGIVRKTITDDLQVNIWENVHMDKIIPSILYNMHNPDFMSVDLESPKDEEHPAYIAETVFRDLICRASYGNVKSTLRPILIHIDNHQLWVPNEFAIKCFKIIMYSVQQQYGYLVIQTLMSHLDKHVKSDPSIKTSIINVLYESVIISAGGSIGPSVLDVFNSLLKHLRISVDNKSSEENQRNKEKKFEEAVINTIGEFANNLPDYQKIEIMMFIMAKFPQFGNEDLGFGTMDTQLQTMLLKTLLKVSTKYKTVTMANTFPPEFLQPLLRISLLEDPIMRLIVQEILHTLIDRHDNTNKLLRIVIPKDISQLRLMLEKVQRQDSMFMKKNNVQFYWSILENVMMESNKVDNFEALYCTMCLISIEMGGDDILLELLRLGLDVQQIALDNHLPLTHQCAIHGLVAAFLNLVSQLMSLPPLCQYVSEVIETRRREAKYLLPDFAFNRTNRPTSCEDLSDLEHDEDYPQSLVLKDNCLFEQSVLQEFLRDCGQDASRLSGSFHQKPHSTMGLKPGEDFAIGGSASDIGSINLEIESPESSPHMGRKSTDEITVESLKRMLAEDKSERKVEDDKKRLEILETFRTAPFEEIVARSEAKSNHFHNKLNEILDMVSRPPDSPEASRKSLEETSGPVFEMQFPDLFVY